MKRIALSILLLTSIICYSQHKTKQKDKPVIQLIPKVISKAKVDTVPKIDSTKDTLTDSLTLDVKAISHSQVKMVLIKDKDADGWFVKYIFPLITLLLGAAIPLVWEHYAGLKRLKKVGQRWSAEVKFLEVPLKEQIEALDDFLVKHATPDYEIPQLYIIDCVLRLLM